MQEPVYTLALKGGDLVDYFASPLKTLEDPAWVSLADIMKVAYGHRGAGFDERRGVDARVSRVIDTPSGKVRIVTQFYALKMLGIAADAGFTDTNLISTITLGFGHASTLAYPDRPRFDVLKMMMQNQLEGIERFHDYVSD
ncbi:hypothetical protein K9U40_21680 [Xanthobacter autotrophicus]|uniref:hypothetical protein n=1 Tax=Xanthobacter TaxID=279 RepID=UPI0024AC7649|nr:hypothetical protein [Xanthobacter autotrophicus]MDI4666911.1 hypothetical protein [Xanthobacter autotrophicus]